jgi:chromosome segregation protein
MRIERIELNGFKSFSEKTIFNFHPGVTAIVGPNGCGKSNIVDAFRWVLGEQSAKSLRGDTMEDVIFSGSASRKPKGMAEVSLVISGVNNGNVNQSAEVTVTRRLYRSGESEYLMNKVPCRLKDIKTVFLDTGLELKTYSILEQGKIDVILNSKPHERRFLIEEVAGVMKYNVRKAEALQKLESAQSNLQRLQDIVTEVKRQINSIERFAKRAEKYKALYEKIKSIEINISVRDADFLKRELDAVIDTENGLKNKETECSTHVHSADVLIEEKKLLCTDKEKVLEETQKKLNSAERDLLEEEGRISLLKSDCENLKERLKRLFARDSELSDEKENINAHADELERNSKDMEHEISGIEKILNSKNQLFLSLERELRDFDEKLDTERKNLFQKVEEFSTARNEIKNLSLMKENLENREKKSKSDLHNLKGELSQHAGTLKSAEKERHDLEKKLKEKDKVKELSSREINERREKLAAKEGSLYKDREELAAMVSRVESLKELDRGRMNVVDDKIKILCHIADIFEPLPEYETAIEAALGEKLNVAVVHDDQDVRRALQFIKEHKKDRSGFLSAKVFPISGNPPVSSSFSEQVIGKAIDFVKIKEGFGNIASLLLNDVMIVENLSTAFDIWKDTVKTSSQRSSPHYFVTVDGDVLEPSGVVYGGTEKNILQVKREIKELEQTILNKKNLIVSSEKEISSERESITSLESIIVSLNNEISAFEKSQHELEVKIAGTHEDKTRQQKKIEFFSLEIEQERKEKERIYSILDAKNETCKTWEKGFS